MVIRNWAVDKRYSLAGDASRVAGEKQFYHNCLGSVFNKIGNYRKKQLRSEKRRLAKASPE